MKSKKKEMKSTKRNTMREFDPMGFLAAISEGKTTRDLDSKHTIFSQGDAADAVFYLEAGKVKLSVVSSRGKEAVLGILEPGSFFGEGCLAGQSLRMATATTMLDSRIVRVDRTAMVSLLHGETEFAELFIGYLLSRNVRIEEDLVDQLFNSSEKRLARTLLLLAHFGKDPRPEEVVPKLSHETLAAMVGTTRSRGELLHEPVQEAGLHRLQRRPEGAQRPPHGGAPRLRAELLATRRRSERPAPDSRHTGDTRLRAGRRGSRPEQ